MCLRCSVWACGLLINPQSFCLYLMHGVWKKVFRKVFQYICFKVFKYSDCIQVAECISIQCITAVQLFRYSIYYNVFQYCPALPVAYDILWTRRANMSLISARDFWASVHPFLHLSLTIINSCCGLQPGGGRGLNIVSHPWVLITRLVPIMFYSIPCNYVYNYVPYYGY